MPRRQSTHIDAINKADIKKRKKHKISFRQIVMFLCVLIAIGSLSYFVYYCYLSSSSTNMASNLSDVKTKKKDFVLQKSAMVTLDNSDKPDILSDYQGLYNLNKSMVGWIKIDGTTIDYPVMQTKNQDYYLNHNFDQEKDNNGSIFIDADCSIWPRSQNLIIYGHNMKSGKMFGSLKGYKSKDYFEKHPVILFDTLYEKGEYQVMYVFSEVVHDEIEVTFKYYQFINANSETEYTSYMKDMAAMSLYDTGVTSEYGDALITLSTCDYSEGSERFVVVAKKIN